MALKERTTPYTSFASSSKGRPLTDRCAVGWGTGGGKDVCGSALLTATTIPVLEDNELTVRIGSMGLGVLEVWVTARETAGRILPSAAGLSLFGRFQS
jgi:hypothetical protein